ncbi:MAG: fused MFS/spermidine synthase [Elusimicrobia bacterium]|nr:fused MFS/spermidine synthase [Elusimicrobiota bacterium]
MLIRVFGTTIEATSTALAVFMGGLALGAWLAGRETDKIKNPLRCYAFIEISVGLLAVAATIVLINLPQLIAGLLPGGAGFAAGLGRGGLRIVVAGAVLLPPTILMGATLPLLTGCLSKSLGEAGGKLSRLYALNTFGAAAGVLAAGFLLIGHLGETATVMAAAALNILIALRVFACRPEETAVLQPEMQPQSLPDAQAGYRKLAFILGLSGFAALGLEVLWTRLLVLATGNSVYAFSAMLGVYLTGIALGSRYAEHKLPALGDPFGTLAKAQALTSALALAGFGVFWLIGRATLDVKYLYTPLTQASDILTMFGWAALIILPVTFIMGFFFPVAVSAGVRLSGRIGEGVGFLYAANTLGAISGSLAAGFVLIPFLGTKYSFILIALSIALTGAILAGMGGAQAKRGYGVWMALPIAAAFAAFIVPDPVFSIIAGRIMHNRPGEIVFHAEEKAGAVTVCFADNGAVQYLYINGSVVSANGPAGSLMSHFPLLFQENPKEMFIIGLGVGSALRSAVLHGIHVDVAELVASVAEAGPLFTPVWDELLKRGKFRVILNDGRNELLMTKKIYDAIVIDVTPPIYSSGAVNVYSRDFFQLAGKKLSAGGVLSLWIPKPCFESDYFMILKSLKAVFPYVNVWAFPKNPGFLALASNNELDMTPKTLEARIKRGRARLDIPQLSAETISRFRIMKNDEVAADSAPYPEVTDDKPFTEFPLARFLAYSPVWR